MLELFFRFVPLDHMKIAEEMLIKTKSPRSNPHTHADDFVTLRFNQRVPNTSLFH